jgi:uncharacterized protein YjbI with pentapeptide repeats
MANPEHLKILKQGVEVWNQWRDENPTIIPMLNHAKFSGLNLYMMNLNGVDLSESDLREAQLIGANLTFTNLMSADLGKSDLWGAFLVGADLWGANLIGANLQVSKLWGTNFNKSKLNGANIEGASLRNTVFGDVDLSKTIGLENVHHQGPSTVGIDTIYRSGGKIPEVFLRGCGVPENFIQYMSSLTGNAFEYYSCFISYSSNDQDFAKRLYADLQNKGVRCWFAPEDMKIGDKIRDRIDQSIRIHDKLLLILTEHSINSEWVEDEVEAAYEQERQRGKTVLFPIRLDSAVTDTDKAWASKLRRSRHIGDFTQWKDHDAYQKAFDRLMRDLKAEGPAGTD